jgi:hypothetical protein
MSEIVDDLKVANVEVTSNLGLRLSGDEPEIKTTQTDAPLIVTAGGDLTLTSSSGAVNIGNAGGEIGFFGVTAFGKQTTAAYTGTAPTTDPVLRNSTFQGYMIDDIVQALKNYGLLA